MKGNNYVLILISTVRLRTDWLKYTHTLTYTHEHAHGHIYTHKHNTQ